MSSQGTAPLHVVLGAGQMGPLIAARLAARGLRVRMVQRRAFAAVPSGVETASADVSDPAAAAEVMRGAAAVYHTATPRYHRWGEELLPLTRGILAGATAARARLVALDNLYAYGQAPGGVMREDTPARPCSRKGAVRAEAAELLLSAGRRGDLPVVIGRASDFVGPGATMASIFGERFWQRLFADKPVELLGEPALPHTYSYVPDLADALVTLGTDAKAEDLGRVWHLPALAAEPTAAWVERFARALGQAPKSTVLGPTILRVFGLFVKEAGEVREMLYQWRAPFVLDDAAFRARFGATPTPAADVVAATLAWARATYAPARPTVRRAA